MESKNMIGGIVSLAVVVICVAAIMMPVLNDATTTEETFTNEGYFRMSETSDETVITWTPSEDATSITINGETVSLDALVSATGTYSIAFADDFILRYSSDASGKLLQVWTSGYLVGMGASSAYTATITINSEGLTWITNADGATATSVTHSGEYFIIDSEGDYIMKNKSTAAYVNPTSTIVYAGGTSAIVSSSTYAGFYLEGTIDDITVTCLNTNVAVSNISANYTEDSTYLDIAELSTITFTTTYNDTSVNQTYSYFLVPYEVTSELTQHLDTAEIALINAIPALVIVSLVVAAVGMLVVRNRD